MSFLLLVSFHLQDARKEKRLKQKTKPRLPKVRVSSLKLLTNFSKAVGQTASSGYSLLRRTKEGGPFQKNGRAGGIPTVDGKECRTGSDEAETAPENEQGCRQRERGTAGEAEARRAGGKAAEGSPATGRGARAR